MTDSDAQPAIAAPSNSPIRKLVGIYLGDSKAHRATRRWRFNVAFAHAKTDAFGTIALLILLGLMLETHADKFVFFTWASVLLGVVGFRSYLGFKHSGSDSFERLCCQRAFVLSVIADGALLATAFFLVVPDLQIPGAPDSANHEYEKLVFLLFAAGSCAWMSAAYACVLEAVIGFLVALILPLSIALFSTGNPFWLLLGFGLIIYLALMATMAVQTAAFTLEPHLTQMINTNLNSELRKEKHEIEMLNESLETDIVTREQVETQLRESRNEAEQLAKELQELTWIDGLTSIANRRQLDRMLEREWSRSAREQQSLALVMLDLDYFKQYNDIYLHQAGDACLRQVAVLLKHCCRRPGDLPARYGGEEFVVVLPNTGLASAVEIAESMRTALMKLAMPHAGSKLPQAIVTTSFGVAAEIPASGATPADLVRTADQTLYAAKERGRNNVKTMHLKATSVRGDR